MKKMIFRILLLLFLGIFLFALWKLWGFRQAYKKGDDEYDDLRDKYVEESTEDGKDPHKCPIEINFADLKKANPDVVGWIYIDKNVNYPIVQTTDNDYYLHRTFEKEQNINGAIFLDAACLPPFDTWNSIVYGHNMNSGKMFGYLKRYYDTAYNKDADYKKHEFIWILTPDKDMEFQVFAAREISVKIDADNNTVYHPAYMIDFEWDEDIEAYLKEAVEKSLYKTRTKPDPADPIVTLSTCTSTTEAGRFIVQGTLIQETDHIDPPAKEKDHKK
jgi:sortase B